MRAAPPILPRRPRDFTGNLIILQSPDARPAPCPRGCERSSRRQPALAAGKPRGRRPSPSPQRRWTWIPLRGEIAVAGEAAAGKAVAVVAVAVVAAAAAAVGAVGAAAAGAAAEAVAARAR